jgi:hypothetical protein
MKKNLRFNKLKNKQKTLCKHKDKFFSKEKHKFNKNLLNLKGSVSKNKKDYKNKQRKRLNKW